MEPAAILTIQLAKPAAVPFHLTHSQSWLLTSMATFPTERLMAFSAPGHFKHSEMGRIFDDLSSDSSGAYEVELGATLPDFFPALDEHMDYAVTVSMGGIAHVLCISNRMVQMHFVRNGEPHFAIFPALAENDYRKNFKEELNSVPALPIKTTVTMRFPMAGRDAEDAIALNFESCSEIFTSCLNKFLNTYQTIGNALFAHQSILYAPSTLGAFYVLIKGGEATKFRHARIAPNLGRAALMPPNLDLPTSERLKNILIGTEEILHPRRFLTAAAVSAQAGQLQSALLQAVISAEVATANYVKAKLRECGVSNSKWNDMKTDVSYSQMLNLHLYSLTPSDSKPNSELLGTLNRARSLRNNLMHEGRETLEKQEIERIIDVTRAHLDYLDSLAI